MYLRRARVFATIICRLPARRARSAKARACASARRPNQTKTKGCAPYEHAPRRGPCRVLERRHGLAEIVEALDERPSSGTRAAVPRRRGVRARVGLP